MFCHNVDTEVKVVQKRCPRCHRARDVAAVPVLAFGCAGAVPIGLHEAIGIGPTASDPQRCSVCSTVLATVGEIVDRPTGNQGLIARVPYGGGIHA